MRSSIFIPCEVLEGIGDCPLCHLRKVLRVTHCVSWFFVKSYPKIDNVEVAVGAGMSSAALPEELVIP